MSWFPLILSRTVLNSKEVKVMSTVVIVGVGPTATVMVNLLDDFQVTVHTCL